MNLPLLSVDLAAYCSNRDAMFAVCRTFGATIAPHIKTPMAPVMAQDLIEHGAWGISVADLRQASVLCAHGIARLIIANEIGGAGAIGRLAALMSAYPKTEIHLFVDSAKFVTMLADRWRADPDLPALRLLVDIGCGRGGTRSQVEVCEVLGAVTAADDTRIMLGGVAAYEGTANRADPTELKAGLDDLFDRVGQAVRSIRQRVGPERTLLLTAGGSSLFDEVIVRSMPLREADGAMQLVLRSGACFFADHGPILERLQAVGRRKLLGEACSDGISRSFAPALRVWAEILSSQPDGLAICGMGLRDVSHDQGLPRPLRLWRNGQPLHAITDRAKLEKLNDQHAFVRFQGGGTEIGDVVEFGIKHPCTTIDKHNVIYALNDDGKVCDVFETFFG